VATVGNIIEKSELSGLGSQSYIRWLICGDLL